MTITRAPAAAPPLRPTRLRGRISRSQTPLAAALVSPTFLVLGLVIGYPVVAGILESLRGQPGLDPNTGFVSTTEPFVGLRNFTDIFTQDGSRFWNAFWNTTFLTVATVTIETVLGVAMALVMHRAFKGRALLRASILIPWAIPTAVSGLLWRWIFNPDGVANALLGTKVLWTTEGFHAQAAVIIADSWKTAPFVGLLVLAGLQVIPPEFYEAARVDGAGAIRQFFTITLPMIKPTLLVAILFRTLDSLRMFDLPYLLIGPHKDSTETLSMLVQDQASNLHYGSAAAYGLVLFVYLFAVVFVFVTLLGADVFGDLRNTPRKRRRPAPARNGIEAAR